MILTKIWDSIVLWNWKVASKLWQFQRLLLNYLTDNYTNSITLGCGIAGIVYVTKPGIDEDKYDAFCFCWEQVKKDKSSAKDLLDCARILKSPHSMYAILCNKEKQENLLLISQDIELFAQKYFEEAHIDSKVENIDSIVAQNHLLLDASWAIKNEILGTLEYSSDLFSEVDKSSSFFKEALAISSVLRGLDKKLETRGRDSCGLSIMFSLHEKDYNSFLENLKKSALFSAFEKRQQIENLSNYTIDTFVGKECVMTFTYKIANVIGQLGDNVSALGGYIKRDAVLQLLMKVPHQFCSTIIHTRWASQGIVSIENCHPVDNKRVFLSKGNQSSEKSFSTNKEIGNIYAVLNGDIDNYSELCKEYENEAEKISKKITTDAKIIPVIIEKYISEGNSIETSFCKAVKRFSGSFAIEMHSNMEPGKIYLALQGKGQGLYIGISPNAYHIASEIYGFVESTSKYIVLEPGQIVVLDQNSPGGLEGLSFLDAQGNKLEKKLALAETPITTRDIFLDTTKYQHFLQKEIHEAPEIIKKTLRGKWQKNNNLLEAKLGIHILPEKIHKKLANNAYRNMCFIGMGTAHAAAQAIAVTFQEILHNCSDIRFSAILATEFMATYSKKNRSDMLVIGISQSGGTTDTNAAIRKFVEDKADILGIINKRDSDMSFLVDGILYTGDGRDVEIAVASTKAFYAQVTAGTLYALAFAKILKESAEKIDTITRELLHLPQKIEALFGHKEIIKRSAYEVAPKNVYWDTLSTGVGVPAANEIKIKLSELCYMSIPSFEAANKKHINLSAEALILCFLGGVSSAGAQSSLAKDLRGEIAIFLAQSNTPVVITCENDTTYDEVIPQEKKPYQLLKVIPETSAYLAVILNTAVGHLWSYYAAESLNERALFLSNILDDVCSLENKLKEKGVDSKQILKHPEFHQALEGHYQEFLVRLRNKDFNNGSLAADITELEKLFLFVLELIPISATPLLFNKNWGTKKVLFEFKAKLSYMRTWLSRSIDAIKHQAKYITVGVTGFEGISDMMDGILKDKFQELLLQSLITRYEEDVNEYDLITLNNVQLGIGKITGGLLYNVYTKDNNIYLEAIVSSMSGNSVNQKTRYSKKTLLRGGRKAIAIKNNKINIGKGHDDDATMSIPIRSLGKIVKILLFKFEAKENISGVEKVKLLGGVDISKSKAEEIFVAIQEHREKIEKMHHFTSDISDTDFLAKMLEKISVSDLLLLPHEDISEKIIFLINECG